MQINLLASSERIWLLTNTNFNKHETQTDEYIDVYLALSRQMDTLYCICIYR